VNQPELFEITDDMATLLEHAADPEHKDKWEESLAAMFDVAAAIFRREGLNDNDAANLAGKAVHGLAKYHGGRHFYLPRNESLDRAIRDRVMFHRWMNGQATPEQLADEQDMTYTRVMQIIAEQRALWRRKHEPGLPGFGV